MQATPAPAAEQMSAVLSEDRPSLLFTDRESKILEGKKSQELLALDKLSLLVAKTDITFVDQWRTEYVPLVFPFSLPRMVGGADYPRRERTRREEDAAMFEPWGILQALGCARRVEYQM